MIQMFCGECVGYEAFASLKDCGACCHLFPYRKSRPQRPVDGGWTSPVCASCVNVLEGTASDPTIPRKSSKNTVPEAKRGYGCCQPDDVDLARKTNHMPSSRDRAVRLSCAACMGDSGRAENCTTVSCWLWPRRGGSVAFLKTAIMNRQIDQTPLAEGVVMPAKDDPVEDAPISEEPLNRPPPLRQPRRSVVLGREVAAGPLRTPRKVVPR